MNHATRAFVSTFGAVMALAGIEHGIGEMLQGSVAPDGLMILSWPHAEFFRSLGGEPAMTVVPNLLITGILAVLVSLALLIWVVGFAQRRNAGLIVMLLSVAMLLLGGGIFPPVLAVFIGFVAMRIHSPTGGRRPRQSSGLRPFLAKLWPWVYIAGIVSWFGLLPGVPLLNVLFGIDNEVIILTMIFLALGSLGLGAVCASVCDAEMLGERQPPVQLIAGHKLRVPGN